MVFELERNIGDAANDVRDRVSRVRQLLPDEVDEPKVQKTEADADPIIYLALTSQIHSPMYTTDVADRVVKDALQTETGVAQVQIIGARRYAMRIELDAAAMAVKAADSKQFPGAGLASLSVPWGVAVNADEPSDYGYNFTWARDLYHAFTAMEAAGDVESALDATEYVYAYQQDENGFIPQNTYVDGRTRWGGEQMDNVSFPQVMAYQLRERHGIGFDEAGYGYEHVRRSAEYVAQNGPTTGQERWEEEAGLSPSTTAAEIAGLACAASLAADEGERRDALVWLALADHWQRHTADWMATDEGTERHAETPYYFRINDDRDPDDGARRGLANGGPTLDERNVIDAGFLELVRLGVTPADDPVVENSLAVVDDTIRVDTPNGPAWYRYNGDGYGEQGQNPDDAFPAGAPWALDNAGKGRLWPIFTGERAEYELLARDDGDGGRGDGRDEGGDGSDDPLDPEAKIPEYKHSAVRVDGVR